MIARMKHVWMVLKQDDVDAVLPALQDLGILHVSSISESKKLKGVDFSSLSNSALEPEINDLSTRISELLKKYEEYRPKKAGIVKTEIVSIAEIRSTLKEAEDKYEEIKNDKVSLAKEAENVIPRIAGISNSLAVLRSRDAIKKRLGVMEGVIILEGWVPAEKASALTNGIDKVTSDYYVEYRNPERDDTVPIDLKNNTLFRPFELLTKLYSPPVYGDVDCTPIFAITFSLIFGIMNADLVDGAVLLVVALFLIYYFRSKNRAIAQIGKLGIFLSISSMIFGIVFGEALGGLIPLKSYFDPFASVTQFIVFVLLLGVAHITLGLLIGIVQDVRKRNARGVAFKFSNMVVIFSVISLLVSFHPEIAWWILAAGFALMIVGRGVMGVLESPRLLSNTVSYGRILAINMAHVGIARAFALLGRDVATGFFGIILAIVIVFIGNFILLTIETMIAFIHTLRLHFVEFFSKFREEYGVWYEPFSMEAV